MTVEEQIHQDDQKKVAFTLQRLPFHTEIDITPKLNPFEDTDGQSTQEAGDMSQLTSGKSEEWLREATSHRPGAAEEEFLPIPLKRIDSGPHQHRLQDPELTADTPREKGESKKDVHHKLLDEIDNSCTQPSDKMKTGKRENTLTRMLKGIRLDKSTSDEAEDKLETHNSFSKIFQRINPVGKVSRENFSKVFHRLGDALQKKSDGEESAEPRGSASQSTSTRVHRPAKIGEKMFRCSSEKNGKPTG